jgi:uncharacterized Tic20 family protein
MALLPPGNTPAPKPPLLEILLAGGVHLSGFFAPFLAPLIVWLITRKWLPYTAQHARQALVSHLLTWLTIGVLGMLAIVVFVLFLGGTISAPPAGNSLWLVYISVFALLVVAALLVWLVGQISFVYEAIRAIQGKPAQTFWRWRRKKQTSGEQA